VTISYLARQPMPQLPKAVESLSSGTVILCGAVLRDGADRPYLPHEALDLLSKVSRVPIHAVTPNMLGRAPSAAASSTSPPRASRRRSWRSGSSVMSGSGLPHRGGEQSVPVRLASAASVGIDESRLPAGSVVRFRQSSVWDLYKGHIIAAVVVIATQSALIPMLLVQRSRRQRAEDRLARAAKSSPTRSA
jgi:hypothetical protein